MTALAKKPPPPPRHLALVRHEATSLEVAQEPFHKIAKDLPPLFERHWRELALNHDAIKLDPDFDRYYDLAVTGTLLVTTARADGVLVGYIFNIIGPHLHYRSTLHAEIEMFWLDPAYRGGWFPVRWLRANEKSLKARGVRNIHVGLKNHFMAGRVGSIFRRMGYKPIETLYGKLI